MDLDGGLTSHVMHGPAPVCWVHSRAGIAQLDWGAPHKGRRGREVWWREIAFLWHDAHRLSPCERRPEMNRVCRPNEEAPRLDPTASGIGAFHHLKVAEMA